MARRLNKVTEEEAPKPPPTYTEEQRQEALDRVTEKFLAMKAGQEKVKRLSGSYRAELKECAKVRGVEPDVIVEALKAKDLETAEIERRQAQLHETLRAMGLPLFDYGGALRPAKRGKAAGDPTDQDAVVDAHNAGLEAGKAGKNRTDNPHPAASRLQDAWAKGWMEGQKANLPNGKTPAAKERRPRAKKGTAASPGLPLTEQTPAQGAAD